MSYTPMEVRAAQAICRLNALACNVDHDDSWKQYSEDFLTDARVVLNAVAAPELLGALQAILPAYRQAVKLYDPSTNDVLTVRAHNAIAYATGGKS